MADEVDNSTQDLQNPTTFSLKEVADAMRTNTEATTMLANAFFKSAALSLEEASTLKNPST